MLIIRCNYRLHLPTKVSLKKLILPQTMNHNIQRQRLSQIILFILAHADA
jgi:hypothetical protein